jgi:very-short-patch-repair endonuclease
MTSPGRLIEWIGERGGIAHTRDARAAGFTDHMSRRAVALGAVRRARRSWLIGEGAHPDAIAAVEAGGRLTCLSEARRRGLWVPHVGERLHVWVPPTFSPPRREEVRYHSGRAPHPVSATAWHDAPVNVLAHVAVCVPREEALAIWESALRRRLVDGAHLSRVAWTSPRTRTLAELASLLSDSGLESILFDRLRPFGLPVQRQVWIEGHPVDGLVGEMLVLQADGFEHHRNAADRRRDIAHDARLTLLGYTVLRFDYVQILFGWADVERTILLAVAQGRHLRK